MDLHATSKETVRRAAIARHLNSLFTANVGHVIVNPGRSALVGASCAVMSDQVRSANVGGLRIMFTFTTGARQVT